jgi:GTP-binding protein HflX
LPGGEDPDVSMDELTLLLESLGIGTALRALQRRSAPDSAGFLGRGKAEELKLAAQSQGVDLLVVDDALTPTQRHNLAAWTGLTVWDRSYVIMKIFEGRAVTAEAKLQVELARLSYEIPSLKGLGHQMSRLGGGIGTRGPGETEFERHRRKLERRAKSIRRELEEVRRRRGRLRDRRRRAGFPTIALVGYTNGGKTTLLARLSKDPALKGEDRLFATLGTTARSIRLPDGSEALLSDTVGFIRKLPPDLVAAFRATLEEVREADLLLLVLDGADEDLEGRFSVVLDTLSELGAAEIPRLVLLNKRDLAGEFAEGVAARLRARGERAISASARTGEGLETLLEALAEGLRNRSEEVEP